MYPKQIAKRAAEAALAKKAEDIVILNLKDLTAIADYFVIATGGSEIHIKTITEAICERLKKEELLHIEGKSGWILLDYGDVIVNIFDREMREFYQLETLWADAERIEI
jgi:ribosome-associated protein